MPSSEAVVIGAGIAGVSAAAALSDHFGTVTLLEKDPGHHLSGFRPGVPQGYFVHSCSSVAAESLSGYFLASRVP